jgi:LPPG:FO 2-phospho-L-lactate transferase
MKVVALAGGVGGAKLVDGLTKILPDDALTVIVNTGDDFDHFGLRICPDLDTVCYTLAGIANPETGWGREDESWNAMKDIEKLGGPTWFRLGDRDLAIHLERTRLLTEGKSLSEICHHFCSTWQIKHPVLPMSNDRISTLVHSDEGDLPFQDYFVRRKCEPQVYGFDFIGADRAVPAPGVLDAMQAADLIVICPSNPWVSIDPILAVPGTREALAGSRQGRGVIAVSPIIQGDTIKGPAAKMFREMGISPSAASVASHYGSKRDGGLLSGYVFDVLDTHEQAAISNLGIHQKITNTIMKKQNDRIDLAVEVIDFGRSLNPHLESEST